MTFRKIDDIIFDKYVIPVYFDLDKPLFLAQDVAFMLNYDPDSVNKLMDLVEEDEKLTGKVFRGGQRRTMWFLTEMGLYNVLSQSRVKSARAWRRIVHTKLIELRRSKGHDIKEQFDEWNHEIDDIYFDDQGRMYQSVTIEGGDVEQICLSEDL